MAYDIIYENDELRLRVKIEGKQMFVRHYTSKEWKEMKVVIIK